MRERLSPFGVRVIAYDPYVSSAEAAALQTTLCSLGTLFCEAQVTYVLSYYIYEYAFQNLPFRYGYASASAVLFVLLAALFVTLQSLLSRRSRANPMRGVHA